MKVKLGISLFLAVFAFVFISQNTETVRVDFLAWSVEMSLVVLVFIILGAGIIIGWSLNSYLRFARNRKQDRAQQEILTKEISSQGKSGEAMQGDKETYE